jgi:hypothetical protein
MGVRATLLSFTLSGIGKVFLDYSLLFSNQEDSYAIEYLFHKTKAIYLNKILTQELQEQQSFQLLSKTIVEFCFWNILLTHDCIRINS